MESRQKAKGSNAEVKVFGEIVDHSSGTVVIENCDQGRLQSFTQRRSISEYAKKMGYKPRIMRSEEGEIQPIKQAVSFAIAGFLFYDVMRDRRLHLDVLMKNFDETYNYYERDRTLFKPPNMDFLVEQLFKLPRGDGSEREMFRDPEHDELTRFPPNKEFGWDPESEKNIYQ